MQTVYLTRRNLQSLLNKLDRNKAAGVPVSRCRLQKYDTVHPTYPCSDIIEVIALEDEAYYIDRAPGDIHPLDVPK